MTEPRFDSIIHATTRLQLCSMLAEIGSLEFAAARQDLGISDSVLSKHVKILAEAGYVRVRQFKSGGKARKSLKLTEQGLAAYRGHVAELKRLIG